MFLHINEDIIRNFVYANFSEAKETSTGEIHFNTPFEKDNKLRLYIDPKNALYFDQKRQEGGSFLKFVKEYLDLPSLNDASKLLIKEYGIFSDQNNNTKLQDLIEIKKELELPEGLKFFNDVDHLGPIGKKALRYLTNRQISPDGLGYIYKKNSDWNNRIFIPFYEEGRMVYFITRAFDKSKLRYKNPSGFNSGDYVYNIDNINEEVFIFEGVFDALSLKHQVSTAILSNRLKEQQAIKILDKMPNRVIFVLDNDKKPETRKIIYNSLRRNVELLRRYSSYYLDLKIYIYKPPEKYKDFNELMVATGKDYIDIGECELYKKNDFNNIIDNINWRK